MEYRELRIQTGRNDLERVEAELTGSGFTAMMIDDPEDVRDILANPDVYRYDYINEELKADLERKPVITLYFADDEEGRSDFARAAELLKNLAEGPESMDIVYSEAVSGDDSEWLYKWQEHFKPTKVGERIVVKPGWEDYTAAEGELVIEMEPGMAFGSGLHETTSMCIKALEKVLPVLPESINVAGAQAKAKAKDVPASAPTLLDVGTGTGILAIAGALLGAGECLGIDIDPDAVRVAGENIERNGLSERISVRYGDLTEGVDCTADILTANLMADLVIKLSPAAAGHLKSGGWYITSGILDTKEDTVAEAVRGAGFAIEEVLSDGEWRAIIARKI